MVDQVYAARNCQTQLNDTESVAAASLADGDEDYLSDQPASNVAENLSIDEDMFNVLSQIEYPVEANEHILHAQAQHELARLRTQEAKEESQNEHEYRR